MKFFLTKWNESTENAVRFWGNWLRIFEIIDNESIPIQLWIQDFCKEDERDFVDSSHSEGGGARSAIVRQSFTEG